MVRTGLILALGAMSLLTSVPAGAIVAMLAAALVGFAALRLNSTAEALALGGLAGAAPVRKLARLYDGLTVALCLLALLVALPFR